MSDPPPQRHLASHIWNVAVLVVSLGLLAVMMHELGWSSAKEVLDDAGRWFPIVIALDLIGLCCDAAAIHAFLSPESRMVSFWRVLAANTSGRAINLVTPGGAIGEATKVTMLVSHAPRDRVLSAIVLFDLAGFYISVAIVIIGVPLTLVFVDLPRDVQIVVWVGLALLAPLVIGIGVLIHRGAIGTLIGAVRGAHLISRERAASWKEKLADVDRHLRELHTDRSPGTRTGLAWMGASRLISWIATGLVLHALHVPITATLLIGVFSVGILIGWVANAVPLGLGIADGSNYALYDALGASGAHGVFVTMLSRARSIVIAAIGLSVMGVAHAANRVSIARRHRHLRELREREQQHLSP